MDNQQPTVIDLVIETHAGRLERQGPGNPEMTIKAIGFLDRPDAILQVADLGCGCAGQTMVRTQNLPGSIVGVDRFADFIDRLHVNAKNKTVGSGYTALLVQWKAFRFPRGIRPDWVERGHRPYWI